MFCKYLHVQQWKTRRNGKPHQNKLNPVPEPNVSIRDNYGALKADTGIIEPGKGKDTNHRENSTRKE